MSFSSEVKNELARLPNAGSCCLKAELSALLRMGGSIIIRSSSMGVDFATENAALARRVLQMIKTNFQLPLEVVVTRSRRLKKNNRYLVRIAPGQQTQKVMSFLGLIYNEEGSSLEKNILQSSCCRKAFLRGVFLAGGSVSRPTGDYHLEIVSESDDLAQVTLKIMKSFGLPGKSTDRKGDYIVYLKEGNAIISFLSLVGAHVALLDFENVRIVKEMRNQVNRVVNCETANLGKVVKAALRQLACINYLEEHYGLGKLPPALREAAELRLANPELPLGELAAMAAGSLGKAGINHRFKKIEQLALKMGMKDEKEVEVKK